MVTRGEVLAAGVTVAELRRRVANGALIAEYRGVYRVGHRAPNTEARYLAAVRACGNGALLAGLAAAHLLDLLRGPGPKPEVLTPTERRVPGVVTRRSRHIDARDATTWRGVPVTAVPRTLIDAAATLSVDELARACHEAGVRFRTTPGQVATVLDRRSNSPGAAKLRAVLWGGVRVTLSQLEGRFLALLRKNALSLPETNRPANGRRVDCRWPELRLTVELDSYRYHNSRHAWEQDRRREREAHARGDELRRYTYGEVFDDPAPMLAELRSLLPAGCPA